jgi:hypothetical protein
VNEWARWGVWLIWFGFACFFLWWVLAVAPLP